MDNFTPAQREVITSDAPKILVSAAAGSGKTAVLTERIVRHVSENVPLSDLLVVTFTKAAAAEMRERIEKRLHENPQLSHHAALLPIADISTIDSFCAKLVRENFQKLDIDPTFRVGDDAELSLVRSIVIDEIFEAEYLEGNADFIDLADVYGGKTSDDRLESLIIKIYNFLDSDPFPALAARRATAAFENIDDLGATPWARIVCVELAAALDDAIAALRRAVDICDLPGGPFRYADKLRDEIEMLEILGRTLGALPPMPPQGDIVPLTPSLGIGKDSGEGLDFGEIYGVFSRISWGALPRITAKDGVDAELKERVLRIRTKAVKERVNKIVARVFLASPEKMIADLRALAPRVGALMRLAVRFADAYAAEKRARNIVDFSDLEHFAIRILYPNSPEDMTPVPPDKTYFEVLIDEYQDSNELQNLILSAVASRRFMVGDIKQSIYRFRRADPSIFGKTYEALGGVDGDSGGRIDLSHNFRSRPEVIGAVNFIFSRLMRRGFGGVDYDEKAALYPGRESYPEGEKFENLKMQIEILEDDGGDDDDGEAVGAVVAETRVIAGCIREVLAQGYRQGDIAILTRSFSRIAGEVVEELKNHGIDAVADMNEGFFEQQEVKTVLAFLRVVDNPRQDIDLITVLTSPVYALDADELLEISRCEGRDFYDKVCGSGKAKSFLRDLNIFRDAAIYMPVSRLIGMIFDTTRYPAHVANMPGGAVRQANLRLLLERAIEFEATSLRGLFHFVRYIERLIEAGGLSAATETEQINDSVRLMSIHKSKGLEFPVVICAFLAKRFNTEDERLPLILHSDLGIGPYYINTVLRTRANTLARTALASLT
ncbi:MAG: UvrD-helicase domain-containing protein, partial [Defluviitaleaceae bacterium]|nr:UvrD-helicase domain-containing protein [Defluviitaleaceae bacterium]